MNKNKLVLGSLFVGTGLVLTRKLFATTAPAKPVRENVSYDAINAYVKAQMQRLHIPGASLAIIEGDKIVHLRGFGKARPAGETPTPQTPFFIGSITKSITALAVMQLFEAGRIELDAPVQRYLPWFRVTDSQISSKMTIRHLLNQTSGMPFLPSEVALADFDDRPAAIERQVRALSSLKISRPVGSEVEYSNFNYNILGLTVETVSGESYANYIQNHIFDPLEMRHSYTSKADAQKDGLAVGYRQWFSFPFPVPNWQVPFGSLPSGQLISCAEDMAHYLIAHLNGGRYGDRQILSRAGIEEMHRGVKELKMGELSGGFYGMGWFDTRIGCTRIVSHGGNTPDFSAYMALLPEHKRGVILLLNADPYGLPFVTDEVGAGMAVLLAEKQPPPIQLDFIKWITRLLPLIPLLQFADVFSTTRKLRRWKNDASLRPTRSLILQRQILLPLIPNLSLAAFVMYLRSSGLIRFLNLFMPDLAWTARISGTFAGIWAFVRTGLILQALRKPRS